ncbi:hypothetical protein TRFO_32784 [Tritrichomonas foetus]|uniref:USP domain-containing protein n=1 Tax=Tritrichomonas foetus TaxID=1144522 RepID=A0A1J4JN53_9EUKA|nr:hypothetical protein TRFO_32784 [Tritrichomonas foetus]|eukprot:OHT00507.1 hypothetical protein TRFO_32784 [Tritrichomonas foetus]
METVSNYLVPNILVIDLVRGFTNNYDRDGDKSVIPVYPYILNFNRINQKVVKAFYILKGVVIHIPGHYYSYVRANIDNKWYIIDGRAKIKEVRKYDFNNKVMNNGDAVMLFYEKINTKLLHYGNNSFSHPVYPDFLSDKELQEKYFSKQKHPKDWHYELVK